MCKLKSAIALKDRIFMPDYDSHSDMLNELGIEDDFIGASKKFVRVELSPTDGDPFSDIDTWKLNVDQDIRPDWFSEEEYRPKIVEAVKEWAKSHIFVGVNGLKLYTGTNYYIKDCKDVEARESSSVVARESSRVVAWESSRNIQLFVFHLEKSKFIDLIRKRNFQRQHRKSDLPIGRL